MALAGQVARPDAVVLVDSGPQADTAVREMALRCGIPPKVLTVVHSSKARTFGQAVAAGLQGRPADGLVWLLHDDVYPEPEALQELVRALERAPSVAIAGPKQVRADDPTRLIEVGVTTTPFGRRVAAGQSGELDQGQYDSREDVLGVGTAGMLMRLEEWVRLSGFDPALGPFRDGLDLCRRARLAGKRVVVAPNAVVLHEQASYWAERDKSSAVKDQRGSFRGRRRALIYTQLVDQPLWAVPVIALAGLLAALGRSIWRLAAKEFGLALDELTALASVFARPARVIRARRVAARERQVGREALRDLQISSGEARRQRRDRRLSQADLRRQRLAPTDIEAAELRHLAGQRRRMGAALALVVVLVTSLSLGHWLGPGTLVGGAAGPQLIGSGQLWSMAGGGWLQFELGQGGPGDPLSAVLAIFRLPLGDGNTMIKVLCLLAPLVAAFGAWLAAGAVSRSTWVRAMVTLFYFASPALWQGLEAGRLGAVLTHAALPYVALGVARAVGANRLDVRPPVVDEQSDAASPALPGQVSLGQRAELAWGSGSVAAAAGAGLAFAVAAAGTPMLLLPGTVLALVVAIFAPKGRHWRMVFVPVPALALFGPLLLEAITAGQWRGLLADPGAAVSYQPSHLGLRALGYITEPTLPGFVPSGLVTTLAVGLVGLVVVAALAGLVRPGAAGRAGRIGWLLVVVGLGLIVAGQQLAVSVTGLETVMAWGGGAASLVLLGLLMAAAAALSGAVGEPGAKSHRLRRALATVGLAALLAGPLAGSAVVVWAWFGGDTFEVHRSRDATLPAIAASEAEGEYATRTLVLALSQQGFSWSVVRGASIDMAAPMGQLGGRRLESIPGTVRPDDAATESLNQLVAAIVARNPGAAARQLAMSGIGFVLVERVQSDPALLAAVDSTPGLARITETESVVLWRVAPGNLPLEGVGVDQVAVLHVAGPNQSVGLSTGPGDHLRAELQADQVAAAKGGGTGADLRLVLAERRDAGWRATLNGKALQPAEDKAWQQSFELPLGASGSIEVWHQSAVPWWLIQGLALALAVVLALPLRRQSQDDQESP